MGKPGVVFVKIAIDFPPLWDEIDAAFHVKGRKVIYAWGDTIYNPYGMPVPPVLMDHEMVHGRRQGKDVIGWWRRYIEDPVFRLNEEIPAHIAEYNHMIRQGNRNDRRQALKLVSGRLSAPLYGGLITKAKAKALLKAGEGF